MTHKAYIHLQGLQSLFEGDTAYENALKFRYLKH